MTQEKFDTYKFSIKTRILVHGEWKKINEINFYDREFYFGGEGYVQLDEVKDIKEES